jgi:hypothetical protein
MLMDRLNEAINFLKTKPDEGELMYQIIYYTFIGEKMNSVYDILNKIGIAKTRYYKLRKKAITMISVKLWTVPDIKLELWLELLSYFEK